MCPEEADSTRAAYGQRSEYVLTKEWPGERERLGLLEQAVDALSINALRTAGMRPGLRCLEIGAGSGSIARWLAHEAGDSRLVTVTDVDPRLLGPLADAGIRVLQHDVTVDSFPTGSVDVVYTRAVLEHITQREHVLDRISSWLAPDGILVVVDCASFPLASSQNPIFRAALQAYIDAVALTGTDYQWARRFPEPLQRRGYRDIGVSVMVPTVQGGTGIAKFWSLTLEATRPRLLAAGLITSQEIDQAQQLLADPDFFDLGPGFIAAWGRRPQQVQNQDNI